MNVDDIFNQKYEVADMVIPKFLLACNPIVPNIDLTYIYSPHYMSLIMVIEENSEIVRIPTEPCASGYMCMICWSNSG